MRGDKSPPTISTNHYNKLLSIGTERHMGRSLQYSALHECRDSACRHSCKTYSLTASAPTNRARSRTLQKIKTSQNNQKLPPRAPAPNRAKQLFVLQGRVLLGEVLGERGRFGGRGAPLSRGAPLPPRSFPSPSKVFPSLPLHHLASRAGGEGVEKKRAAGGETNAQTRVTAFPNPPRHPPERRRA